MLPKIKKALDLTQDIYHACPAWPTYKYTNLNYEAQIVTHGFNAERIEMNTHTGTHCDVPFHFFNEGRKLEDVNLVQLTGRAIVIDLRHIGSMGITAAHLVQHQDRIKKNDIVLLYTGWAQKRGTNREYLFKWPYVTQEAARWLVNKKVKCVCIDGLSVGGWPEGTGRPPHLELLGNDIIVLEELYMDMQLFEEDEWFIVALPMKIRGVGGAPTRVIALSFE